MGHDIKSPKAQYNSNIAPTYVNDNNMNANNIYTNNNNSKYVSVIMNQEREKIRSHENKMNFFFEKNIEDYAKPLQKQENDLKQSYKEFR